MALRIIFGALALALSPQVLFGEDISLTSLGVSLSGPEFASDKLPGVASRDYTFNSLQSYRYFSRSGLRLIRLPLLWERLQPVLSGPLDSPYLDLVRKSVAWARDTHCRVILDLHNYARYALLENGARRSYVIGNSYEGAVKVPAEALADLWARLSAEFKEEPAIVAYGLMNEPHDLGGADWKAISQLALEAIRKRGDHKLVLVSGDGWSGADRWSGNNGPRSWIADPANHFQYEAHEYFDHDGSGTYGWSYDQELAANPELPRIGVRRLADFAAWCRANQVGGFLGEFGVPGHDPRWLPVMNAFLAALRSEGFGGTYWTAGEWYGDYPLSLQPREGFSADAPQLETFRKHLPPE